MVNEKVINNTNQFIPEDFIISALLSLNSHLDWHILFDLSEHEKTFIELVKDLGIEDKKLEYHIEKLLKNGIITHYYRNEFLNPNYSFYALSNLGRKIIENINRIVNFSDKQTELKKKTRV